MAAPSSTMRQTIAMEGREAAASMRAGELLNAQYATNGALHENDIMRGLACHLDRHRLQDREEGVSGEACWRPRWN